MGEVNEYLRRAVEALEAGAREARGLRGAAIRDQLRRTVEEVLDHLEADERARAGQPEDVVARLNRQSQDIAEDLRRADRLMREGR